MNLTNVAIRQLQDAPFPDFVTRPAIDSLVTEARKRLDRDGPHDEAAFAREMAPFGVTVNAVAPGPIPTRLIAGVPEEKINALRARQVMPAPLTPDDVWDVVSLLLEKRSGSLSGEILHVGGV